MPSREFINRKGSVWERTSFEGKSFPEIRAEMEQTVIGELRHYEDVSWEPGNAGDVSGKWVRPMETKEGLIYYIHGGGFTLGSSGIPMPFLMELSHRLGITCFSADYTLAPEATFPSAPNEVFRGYQALLEMGFSAEKIILCGESAGATLALDIPLMCKEQGVPQPRAVIALSPVTDATAPVEGTVLEGLDDSSAIYRLYAPGYELSHPWISPALGDLRDYPATFLSAGGAEVLMQDSLIFAKAAAKAGADVHLHIGKEMIHTYPLDFWDYPEAMEAFDEIELFISQQLRR